MYMFVGIVHLSDASKTRVVQLKCMLIMGIYMYVYSVPCYLNGVIRGNSLMWIATCQTDHKSGNLHIACACAFASLVDGHCFEY